VQSFPGSGAPSQVSIAGGSQARWRRDGRELFYVAPDRRLMAVPIRATQNRGKMDIGASVPLFSLGAGALVNYMVSPDGRRFLVNPRRAAKRVHVSCSSSTGRGNSITVPGDACGVARRGAQLSLDAGESSSQACSSAVYGRMIAAVALRNSQRTRRKTRWPDQGIM